MSDFDAKWDKQWRQLLTHCHGEEVPARKEFKHNLLADLRRKMSDASLASSSSASVTGSALSAAVTGVQTADNDAITLDSMVTVNNVTAEVADTSNNNDDSRWSRLMQNSYTPCHADNAFKAALLVKLKAKQRALCSDEAIDAVTSASNEEEETFRTILSRTYLPINARPEFQNRLLDNLKERQRHTSNVRNQSRRRTFLLSAASSLAAAAMVMFAVWVSPSSLQTQPPALAHAEAFASLPVPPVSHEVGDANSGQRMDLRLPVPDASMRRMELSVAGNPRVIPASFGGGSTVRSDSALADVVPTSYATVPAEFADYRVKDAFAGEVLPKKAYALQNIELNSGDVESRWETVAGPAAIPVEAGMSFRSTGTNMGHMQFADGALLTMSPNSLIKATVNGLMVIQGFMLISVPEVATKRFRLHFNERDLAVEPGTDLAVMVENPEGFAEGGAPAPMVMVVDRPDATRGGLALAMGKNGVGPLFAKQLYKLDRYVTPDLPGRTLCDTERAELNQLFKCEEVRQEGNPKVSFAGGFSGEREVGGGTMMMLTPAGYHKRGDVWVADSYRGQDTVKLRYLSDAYFGFANVRRDLSRDLALGGEVIIDGGNGSFYEIIK